MRRGGEDRGRERGNNFERMNKEDIGFDVRKKVLDMTVAGKRTVGRPKRRWEEC